MTNNCKYCEDVLVDAHGEICPRCYKISRKVKDEERHHWRTVVEQHIQELIERMR